MRVVHAAPKAEAVVVEEDAVVEDAEVVVVAAVEEGVARKKVGAGLAV